LAVLVVLCGCLDSERVLREYVCPDGRVVSAPQACAVVQATSTTAAASSIVSSSTTSSSQTTSSTSPPTTSTNPEVCGGFRGDERQECLAVAERNVSLCPYPGLEYRMNLLTDSLFLALGQDVIGDAKIDRSVDVFSKSDTCVMKVINLLGSAGECESFPVRQLCTERFIVASDNASMCGSLPQGSMQQGCYYALIRLNGNEEACSKYPEYGRCLVKAAAKYDDFRLCQRVYGDNKHEDMLRCVEDAKYERCMASDEINDCCLDVDLSAMNSCYIQKAKATGNPFWCRRTDGSGGSVEYWDCYVELAVKKSDAGICGLISSIEKRDYCLREIVDLTGEKKLCEGIFDEREKRRCRYGLP
jgi:hypothetical protein